MEEYPLMPYIADKREDLRRKLDVPSNCGELNYVITDTLIEYIETKGLSYQTINDILGALDGASKEFYRRVAEPYEDEKIKQNGDVYGG